MVAATKMGGSAVLLQPTQKLSGVRKEWHTRKQGGRDVCCVATDRLGEWLVLTQKLPLLTAWINETLGDEPSKHVGAMHKAHPLVDIRSNYSDRLAQCVCCVAAGKWGTRAM